MWGSVVFALTRADRAQPVLSRYSTAFKANADASNTMRLLLAMAQYGSVLLAGPFVLLFTVASAGVRAAIFVAVPKEAEDGEVNTPFAYVQAHMHGTARHTHNMPTHCQQPNTHV